GLFFAFTFRTGADEGDVEQAAVVFVDDHAGTAGVALGVKADPGYEPSSCRSSITSHSRSPSGARSFSSRPARPVPPIQDRSSTVLPLPGGADTTVTRPVAPIRSPTARTETTPTAQDRRPCGQRTPNSRQAA